MFKLFNILAYILLVIPRMSHGRPGEPVSLARGDIGNENISLDPFPGKSQIGKGIGHPITVYEGPEVE
jgi:hypothetical protein